MRIRTHVFPEGYLLDVPPGAYAATPILEEHGHPTDMENVDTDIPVGYRESPPDRPFLWQLHPKLRIAGMPVYRPVPMIISVQLRVISRELGRAIMSLLITYPIYLTSLTSLTSFSNFNI